MRSRNVTCVIDLDRIRSSVLRIRAQTRVRLVAVIKADAYGLGAARVADAIVGVADELAYFSVGEAREVGKPGIVIGPPEGDPAEYRELQLRPTVSSIEDAARFAGMPLAVSVDTGMQRFGCDPRDLEAIMRIASPVEIHTHAGNLAAIERLRLVAGGFGRPLLGASTSMLGAASAWLDGVRPGVGLYRGAMRVSTRLHSVRETHGPIGYTGFSAPRVGILLVGYSNGLQPAPLSINGRRQRFLEIGMNSSYVSIDARDRTGDEVVLLGDGVTESEVAQSLNVREHEVLCRYGAMGVRQYEALPATGDEAACAVRPPLSV